MPEGPKFPKYIIRPTHFGPVLYPDRSSVGFHFTDPKGDDIFVSLPGDSLPWLIGQLQKLVDDHPEALSWPQVPLPAKP